MMCSSRATAGNPVGLVTDFTADRSCYYNLFDALVPQGTGQAILEWGVPDKAVRIFNVRGELVRLLYNEMTPSGHGTLTWDGTGADNRPSPSGV